MPGLPDPQLVEDGVQVHPVLVRLRKINVVLLAAEAALQVVLSVN